MLVLVTSVYPTGDCGLDAGHIEAYTVAEDGTIHRHMSAASFRHFAKEHPQ
jgi:hypothetical protein